MKNETMTIRDLVRKFVRREISPFGFEKALSTVFEREVKNRLKGVIRANCTRIGQDPAISDEEAEEAFWANLELLKKAS